MKPISKFGKNSYVEDYDDDYEEGEERDYIEIEVTLEDGSIETTLIGLEEAAELINTLNFIISEERLDYDEIVEELEMWKKMYSEQNIRLN